MGLFNVEHAKNKMLRHSRVKHLKGEGFGEMSCFSQQALKINQAKCPIQPYSGSKTISE